MLKKSHKVMIGVVVFLTVLFGLYPLSFGPAAYLSVKLGIKKGDRAALLLQKFYLPVETAFRCNGSMISYVDWWAGPLDNNPGAEWWNFGLTLGDAKDN